VTRRKQSKPTVERQFRAEAVMRPTPDLHRLAQVFLGMAIARAQDEKKTTPNAPTGTEPDSAPVGAVD
jgi:hypothetical protein